MKNIIILDCFVATLLAMTAKKQNVIANEVKQSREVKSEELRVKS